MVRHKDLAFLLTCSPMRECCCPRTTFWDCAVLVCYGSKVNIRNCEVNVWIVLATRPCQEDRKRGMPINVVLVRGRQEECRLCDFCLSFWQLVRVRKTGRGACRSMFCLSGRQDKRRLCDFCLSFWQLVRVRKTGRGARRSMFCLSGRQEERRLCDCCLSFWQLVRVRSMKIVNLGVHAGVHCRAGAGRSS